MAENAVVQTRIDPAIKQAAAAVLEKVGLTVSDAVRILLTRTANEGMLPFALTGDAAAHDKWFRAMVQEAVDDPRDPVAHEEVAAQFARRRATTLQGKL